MRERDLNFKENPYEGPQDINWKYYLGVGVPEWNGSFDESAAKEGMNGVYQENEAEGKAIMFEDPVDDEEEEPVGGELEVN